MAKTKVNEEPLKNAVQQNFFADYNYTQLGNIDFVIAKNITDDKGLTFLDRLDNDRLISILWAEAKRGTHKDIYESFVQLILTIGKERTFEKYIPPKFIGAFDAEKIAFIEYNKIQHIFVLNDFNWMVTPSNHDTKEFKQLYDLCKSLLEETTVLFYFKDNEKELRKFIRSNFNKDKGATEKINVTKNNFTFVYQRWLQGVKPTIGIDWKKVNRSGILEADFFLADLLSRNNQSLKDNLYVVLKDKNYELEKRIDDAGLTSVKTVSFNDGQKAHQQFWSIYVRPPKKEYWAYIIGRRDLLVPPDIREVEGSYFTPQIWVEKSQQYLTEVLGENWQDEYYIWDNCGGTGNLENGLTNKRNIWVSTLEDADVKVMKDMVANGFNLFEDHIFKFDFLNGEFVPQSKGGEIPDELYEIIQDPEKRKKLVIYINPPYVEPTNAKTVTGSGSNRTGVSSENKTYEKYKHLLRDGSKELSAQFIMRIYKEIPNCILGVFSKIKLWVSTNFVDFREVYNARLLKMFTVPSKTFDNIKGKYPIAFSIWDTTQKRVESEYAVSDLYDAKGGYLGTRQFYQLSRQSLSINQWIKNLDLAESNVIAYMENPTPDFQNNGYLCILNEKGTRHNNYSKINNETLIVNAVYLAVRHSIPATWFNDRDQFLAPNDGWKTDRIFQGDCLIHTLFHGQNRITSNQGINHWIPFTEEQVGCTKAFKSNFMSKYLANFKKGNVAIIPTELRLPQAEAPISPTATEFSPEAQAVYDAGLELWKYYHSQSKANPNASFYDIRAYFQGFKADGKMNPSSSDAKYMELITNLRNKQKDLAKQIAKKVYEYEFLK